MPVFQSGNIACKYIRFQRLAETIHMGKTAGPAAKMQQTHIRDGNFIRWGLGPRSSCGLGRRHFGQCVPTGAPKDNPPTGGQSPSCRRGQKRVGTEGQRSTSARRTVSGVFHDCRRKDLGHKASPTFSPAFVLAPRGRKPECLRTSPVHYRFRIGALHLLRRACPRSESGQRCTERPWTSQP